MKNLKTKYREVKDHNRETGRGRITCKFYAELDRILGHRPASVPLFLLDTGDSSSTQVEPQESEEETDGKNTTFHGRMVYVSLHKQLCCLQVEPKCRYTLP